jgi:hypothetical protein
LDVTISATYGEGFATGLAVHYWQERNIGAAVVAAYVIARDKPLLYLG